MARKFAKHAWLMAVLTAVPFYSLAQQKPLSVHLAPDAGWRQVASTPSPVSQVTQLGGDPAVEREYGVKSLDFRTYQMGKIRAEVIVEPAPDVVSAYGLLTFYQTPEMTPEKGFGLAIGDASQVLMARGDNFLRFPRAKNPALTDEEFRALMTFVGGVQPPMSEQSSLPPSLPPNGLVPGSEKYLLGLEAAKRLLPSFRTDLIGFEQGAEMQLGQYKTEKGAATLLSINYPTPQIARVRFGALTHFLALNQDTGENSVYGRRRLTYVFLVLNAENPAQASNLLSQFQVKSSISWDQPVNPQRTFTLQVVHMILAILLLTAYLIGACLVAGLLFYLSKRIAFKYFPDSNWGRTDEDQLIRLNLRT